MFFTLLVLFVVVPLLELALLVWVGQRVGILATIALVGVTGILGAALARHQGLATLERFRRNLEQGTLPHRELVDGILILLAAAVLLTPGLLTDAAGFSLLVPPVRRRIRRSLLAWIQRRFVVTTSGVDALDVEFEIEADERRRR